MVETVGGRIRRVREEKEVEAGALAQQAGIAYSTLMDLENDRSKGSKHLHKIASALRVRTSWLETGQGPREGVDDPEPTWEDVLAFAQAVGLGKGKQAEEYAETHKLKFRTNSLRRKGLESSRLRVYYGSGDSMEPRIRKGDAILFDEGDTKVVDDAIYIVLWKGEYYAKRAEVIEDIVLFKSDNPEGDHEWRKPKRMDAKRDPVEVIGRVRWIGSWEG